MAKPKKSGLGKGLEALFADNTTTEPAINTLHIDEIEPNRSQPRSSFDPQQLLELSESIRQHGVLQPLVVRPMANGRYQIVAGERRWRAARSAGITQLPVVVKELSDREAMELALVENLMREDLTPMEEALGYRQLMEVYGLTQEEIAQRVGRSRPAVANALRLLSLPEEVAQLLNAGKLTAGHARALVPLEKQHAIELARLIVEKGLSVRQAEELAKQKPQAAPTKILKAGEGMSYYKEIELSLHEYLGRKVKVVADSKGKGRLTLSFHSRDELEEFVRLLAPNDDNR